MDTLNYADEKLRKKLPTPWAWGVLIAAVLMVTVGPPGLRFLREYFLGGSGSWLSDDVIFYTIWSVGGLAVLAWGYVVLRICLGRDDGKLRRMKKCWLPLVVALGLPPLCLVTYEYRECAVVWMEARHKAAMDKGLSLAATLRNYLADYPGRNRGPASFPPHLAALVTSRWGKASDLVFGGASGAKIPDETVRSDWPRYAKAIEENCDWVYTGADIVSDDAVSGGKLDGGDIIIAYSRDTFFHHGYLVIDAELKAEFVPARDFAARFARHNARRVEFFLSATTKGQNTTPPPERSGPEMVHMRDAIRYSQFFPDYGGGRLRAPNALQCAVLNYAIEHDGYFPQHPAVLLAGQYIHANDLIDPSGETTAYLGNTLQLHEKDWVSIKDEVEKHCDFIFAGADLRLPRGTPMTEPMSEGVIAFYSKLVHPDEMRLNYSVTGIQDAPSSSYAWRGRWVRSNRARAVLGLSLQVPDTAHENPQGNAVMGLPAAGVGRDMEISRRNVEVIAMEFRLSRLTPHALQPPHVVDMVYQGWISPRHLKDPATKTEVLSLVDFRWENWRKFARSIEADKVYSDYRVKDGLEFKLPTTVHVVAYSMNTFNGTGRIVGYSDGRTAFVAKDKLPPEVVPVE